MENLSPDDLLYIFRFCHLHDWIQIEQTCRLWRNLILRKWSQVRRVDLSKLIGLKKQNPFFGPFPRHFVRPQLIRFLARRCGGSLREILAGECRLHMEKSCLPVLSEAFAQLQLIDLSNTVFIPSESEPDGNLVPFVNVDYLGLNSCVDDSCSCYYSPDEVDAHFHLILSAMPHVTQVYLSHNMALDGAALLALPIDSLTVLDLSFCRRLADEILSNVFSHLTHLTSVSLYSHHRLNGSCLTHLNTEIATVDLSYCDSITAENFQNFLQFHRCISTLKISHLNCITNSLLAQLSELPQLISLTLNSYFRFIFYESQRHPTDIYAGICSIGNMATLEHLDISRNEFVDDGAIRQLAYCRALKSLNMSNLQLVTADAFVHLTNLCCLETLDVSLNDHVDVDILLAIAHRNPSLNLITAHHCAKVKLADIERIGHLWPEGTPTVFQLF